MAATGSFAADASNEPPELPGHAGIRARWSSPGLGSTRQHEDTAPGCSGPQVNDRVELRDAAAPSTGEPDDDRRVPMVVIDGREISWDELGRMVAAFEGWQFKLEFRDRSEEV
jgi:hypothetical protein